MGTDAIGSTGSNAPHANVQPNTVLNFGIAATRAQARPHRRDAARWPSLPGQASSR